MPWTPDPPEAVKNERSASVSVQVFEGRAQGLSARRRFSAREPETTSDTINSKNQLFVKTGQVQRPGAPIVDEGHATPLSLLSMSRPVWRYCRVRRVSCARKNPVWSGPARLP